MTRKQLLKSNDYWVTQFQINLYEKISNCIRKHKISIKEFCSQKQLSIYKIKQVIKGDWEGTIHEYVYLIMCCNKVPIITIESIKDQK